MRITLEQLRQLINEASGVQNPLSPDDPGLTAIKQSLAIGFSDSSGALATAVENVIKPGCLSEFEASRVLSELSKLGFEVVKKRSEG